MSEKQSLINRQFDEWREMIEVLVADYVLEDEDESV